MRRRLDREASAAKLDTPPSNRVRQLKFLQSRRPGPYSRTDFDRWRIAGNDEDFAFPRVERVGRVPPELPAARSAVTV
jgi:hypothetical protein